MTFLELCQETAEQSGTIAGIPSFTTVAGATGRLAKLVRWVRNANRDIENERTDWRWMRQEFTKALVIGQMEYTPAGWTLSVQRWLRDHATRRTMSLYDPAIGQSDEGPISFVPYDYWREHYNRGSHDRNRPQYWSIAPNNSIVFGPKPDKAYVVRGEYARTTQMLTNDSDQPGMPAAYQGLIVGEALRLMARSDEAFEVLGERAQQYERLRAPLVEDQTDPMDNMWGGTLGW